MTETRLQEAVKTLKPGTVAGKVRAIMPEIERQIESGVTWAEIVEALNAAGLELTYNNFQSILYRYRKKHGHHPAATPADVTPASPAPVETTSIPEAEPDPAPTPATPDEDAFARAFDPDTRYKTADRLMQGRRRFGHHTKRKDEK